MTEGFRSSPPPPEFPVRTGDSARYREEVKQTVQAIMNDDAPSAVTPTGSGNGSGASSVTDTAKEQSAEVADTAKQAAGQVAGTVKEQAGQVTEEARQQAKQLLSQAQSELSEQAANTQQRVAQGLQALADELSGMAKNSEQDGVATDLARQAADRARSAAGWLADRDPGNLVNEVRSFARQKPGAYLAIALGAGVLAGRLTRGLSASTDDSSSTVTAGAPIHRVGAAGYGLADTYTGATDFDPVSVLPSPPAGSALGDTGALGARGAVAP